MLTIGAESGVSAFASLHEVATVRIISAEPERTTFFIQETDANEPPRFEIGDLMTAKETAKPTDDCGRWRTTAEC